MTTIQKVLCATLLISMVVFLFLIQFFVARSNQRDQVRSVARRIAYATPKLPCGEKPVETSGVLEIETDSWGHPFAFTILQQALFNRATVTSLGPDGKRSEDDITYSHTENHFARHISSIGIAGVEQNNEGEQQ